MKDKLYTLMVSAVTVGGTLLAAWGLLIIFDRVFAALGL